MSNIDRRQYMTAGGAAVIGGLIGYFGHSTLNPQAAQKAVDSGAGDNYLGVYGDVYPIPKGAMPEKIVFNTGEPWYGAREATHSQYEELYGVKVEPFFMAGVEIIEKLKSKNHGIDLAFMTTFNTMEHLRRDGYTWMAPLDMDLIPNYNLVESYFRDVLIPEYYQDDDGNTYGIPNIWGEDTVVYDHDEVAVEEPDAGLDLLFSDEFGKDNVTMPGGAFGRLQTVAVAAMYIGAKGRGTPRIPGFMDATDEELKECEEVLVNQKKELIRAYWDTMGDFSNLVVNKEVNRGFGWRPIVKMIRNAGIDARWGANPDATIGWVTGPGLCADAVPERVEAAHLMANWLFGPYWGNIQGEWSNYKVSAFEMIQKAMPSSLRDEVYPPVFENPRAYFDKLNWQVNYERREAYIETFERVLAK